MTGVNCTRLRALALRGEDAHAIAAEGRTPAQSTVQDHLKGRCPCAGPLPNLKYSGDRWIPNGIPDCPRCDTDLLVQRHTANGPLWFQCHGCDDDFNLARVAEDVTP